jgi:hypothetical protein
VGVDVSIHEHAENINKEKEKQKTQILSQLKTRNLPGQPKVGV